MSRETSQGFSLIEVLIALFLLGIVLLAVTPLFVAATRQNTVGADLGAAGAVAVERMELLRGQLYTSLPAGGDLNSDTTVAGTPYFDASTPGFVVRWQIADNATPAQTKIINVRAVANRQVVGRAKSVTLTVLRGG